MVSRKYIYALNIIEIVYSDDQNLSTDALVKICSALHCDTGDIMEVVDL
ncbi:MAG TPA: helix-turn-helix transcriptional regulator [Candidatus Oscillibacter excrementigallinarum]|uniref:Helix-turn-helix transcriptional regulator n=1 Tax=Candidatus Oscillibacter excrementigallinarum TaxID=2838716 RepID=A0A9D2LHU3_9FIRM|nr:helix-turn-helix transcriptional regulator [Candidatus Oscillibacter excrementigallinarum]